MPIQPSQRCHQSSSWWLDIFLLTLVLGGYFFILLGGRPLFVPDEGRYAEIAREMVASHNYMTPYLNGIKYFEKPILFYWMLAGSIKVFGLNLWALRSVNAVIGLLGCLLTYATTRKLYDRKTGLLAAFILATSTLYFVMVHMISLDLPVTVFLAASLYAFLLGTHAPEASTTRRYYLWAAAFAAALAVLTKGLIGLVFPVMIIGCWMLILGNIRLLKHLYLPSCLVIFLLVAAPWHLLVGLHNPEFFYFYFIEQHFLRYATPEVGHYQPVWFFVPYLLVGFFPWTVFLLQALFQPFLLVIKERRAYAIELFFLLWAILIFIFFSFSKSKLIPYILPVFPPLAILTARYLTVNTQKSWGIRLGYVSLFIISILIGLGLGLFTRYVPVVDPKSASFYLRIAACVLVVGSFIATILAFRKLNRALVLTIATAGVFLLLVLAAIPAIDTRTILPLATILKPLLKPQDDVVTYNQYYQDLPFYLERRVSVLNWKNELSYGMQQVDTKDWMIDDTTFWQRFRSDRRVFVVLSKDALAKLQKDMPQEHFYPLGETTTNVLISNQNVTGEN